MIGSADLFRSWNDVGANGLSDVERIARAEYRDGDRVLLRQAAATRALREPTILARLAAALHLVRAPGRVSATAPAGIHPGIAVLHFAEEHGHFPESHFHVEPQAIVLGTGAETCDHLHAECNEY